MTLRKYGKLIYKIYFFQNLIIPMVAYCNKVHSSHDMETEDLPLL